MRFRQVAALCATVLLFGGLSFADDKPKNSPNPPTPQTQKPAEPQPGAPEGRRPPQGRIAFEDAKLEVVRLKNADSPEIAQLLSQTFAATGGGLIANADPTTNSVLLVAQSDSVLAIARDLIVKLDIAPDRAQATGRATQVVQLVNADSHILVQVLNTVLPGAGPGRPAQARVAEDPRSNSVIVSGDADVVKQHVDLIQRLDQQPGRRSAVDADRQIQIVELKHARADMLGGTIQNVIKMMHVDAGVTADAPSGTLILYATQRDFDELLKVIQRLDIPQKAYAKPKGPPPAKENETEPDGKQS